MARYTRREALQLGVAGCVYKFYEPPFKAEPCHPEEPREKRVVSPFSPQIERFVRELHIPKDLDPAKSTSKVDYYEITLKKDLKKILPDPYPETVIWGYNGLTPGPTIRHVGGDCKGNRRASVVRFINELGKDDDGCDINAVVHLHGMASLPQYDGHAEDFIPPGYFKNYEYPNDHNATFWYHDHAIDHTARNVYMGLAGMYIIEDKEELALGLPKGEYDVPLILQDKQFNSDGTVLFDTGRNRSLYGDVILVNGDPWPYMEVARRKYRFRILNASASRNFLLMLSQDCKRQTLGDEMVVISSDGGLLRHPVTLKSPFQSLPVAMAERYDVIIDFSRYEPDTEVYLRNVGFTGTIDSDTRAHDVMCFKVTNQAVKDDSEIPFDLGEVDPIIRPGTEINNERTFRFERNQGIWKINNKIWDKCRVDANPNRDDVEIWNLVNPGSGWVHPVHIHLVQSQILSRNGLPPKPYEAGWKDVFHLEEFQTVRVAIRFNTRSNNIEEPRIGKYMMHCHNLVHEDRSMMTLFEVGKGGPDPILSAPAQPVSEMSPF